MNHNLILNYVLTDLLDGKTMPEEVLRDKLQDLNWIREKDLYIIVISDRDQQRLDIKIPAVIQALKEFIPLENCTVFQANITAFIPGSLYDDLYARSKSEFIKFLQVNSLRAGTSMRFSELSACKRYYSQAEKALAVGQKQNITLSAFKDSTLDIVSEFIISEYNVLDFCHPAVLQLWEYDQQNHVNLLPSLNSYLNFMSSPNDAAKELCIHRNTLFYRINKIKDITGIDLKHVSEISHLYFSIKLMKINGYEINY
jgi:sugar diacid utilization regulator